MAHEDLYAKIEERRSELLEDLARARKLREEVSANIKAAQDALDALPVPKTRRAKKVYKRDVDGRETEAAERRAGA